MVGFVSFVSCPVKTCTTLSIDCVWRATSSKLAVAASDDVGTVTLGAGAGDGLCPPGWPPVPRPRPPLPPPLWLPPPLPLLPPLRSGDLTSLTTREATCPRTLSVDADVRRPSRKADKSSSSAWKACFCDPVAMSLQYCKTCHGT